MRDRGRELHRAVFDVTPIPYLAAVLTWSIATPINLGRWPALAHYLGGLMERPAFARAFGEERALWMERNPEEAKALLGRA